VLDTAPSYGHGGGDEHHNERLVARALATFSGEGVRVVTKAGLSRRGKTWVPDGRAKSLRASCLASLQALGVPKLDLLLLHAPDPKTPIATSVRALAALQEDGLVRGIGVCNVSLAELEIARGEAEIEVVQLALGAFDDAPFRSGLAARTAELGIRLLAHTPLGGPKKVARLARDPELAPLAEKYGVSAGTLVLAWLYGLGPIVPLPGARRAETARAAVAAAALVLDAEDRARLDHRFHAGARAFGRIASVPRAARSDAEIVLVMGIQGAGKSRHVQRYTDAGYERLNRDLLGGTLSGLARLLEQRLAEGGSRFVLDNTYLTRALRSHVLDVARAHGVAARCVWLDTPLAAAQVNAAQRLLERHGRIPEPDELRALSRRDPSTFAPTVQLRSQRELEPPSADEGFAAIETVPFERAGDPDATRSGVAVALGALEAGDLELPPAQPGDPPLLIFAWTDADLDPSAIAARFDRPIELAVCRHGGGPPRCWCRPPLPGLLLPWQRRQRIDPARCLLFGVNATHRRLAEALGYGYRDRISCPQGSSASSESASSRKR
jgi:aryl-alcohol dehydrogenase-like predicted oxidoreductase